MRALALSVVLLCALVACEPGTEERDRDAFDGALVLVEPSGTIAEHVAAGVRRWGDDFAIAVIRAAGPPECEADADDQTTYCNVRVNATRRVRAGALPDEPFWLHYWYPSDAHFPLEEGAEFLGFLAPTHQPGSLAPSALLQPTGANLAEAEAEAESLGGA